MKHAGLFIYIWRTPGKQLFKRSPRGESGQKETYILAGKKRLVWFQGNIFRNRDPEGRLSGLCGQTLNCKLQTTEAFFFLRNRFSLKLHLALREPNHDPRSTVTALS